MPGREEGRGWGEAADIENREELAKEPSSSPKSQDEVHSDGMRPAGQIPPAGPGRECFPVPWTAVGVASG